MVHRSLEESEGITLTPPLDYITTVHVLKHVYLVLTDSSGLQEEAPSLGKPVLELRDVTERPEGVETGTARIVGARRQEIVKETVRLLEEPTAYTAMASAVNPFGDGKASQRIAQAILAGVKGRQGDTMNRGNKERGDRGIGDKGTGSAFSSKLELRNSKSDSP